MNRKKFLGVFTTFLAALAAPFKARATKDLFVGPQFDKDISALRAYDGDFRDAITLTPDPVPLHGDLPPGLHAYGSQVVTSPAPEGLLTREWLAYNLELAERAIGRRVHTVVLSRRMALQSLLRFSNVEYPGETFETLQMLTRVRLACFPGATFVAAVQEKGRNIHFLG
jgi:hypothetical protein